MFAILGRFRATGHFADLGVLGHRLQQAVFHLANAPGHRAVFRQRILQDIPHHAEFHGAVSYTHLDVYKRQLMGLSTFLLPVFFFRSTFLFLVFSCSPS